MVTFCSVQICNSSHSIWISWGSNGITRVCLYAHNQSHQWNRWRLSYPRCIPYDTLEPLPDRLHWATKDTPHWHSRSGYEVGLKRICQVGAFMYNTFKSSKASCIGGDIAIKCIYWSLGTKFSSLPSIAHPTGVDDNLPFCSCSSKQRSGDME